jgi:hypothetical protein
MSILSDPAAQARATRWIAVRDELNKTADEWVREAVDYGIDSRDARKMVAEAGYSGWMDDRAAELEREREHGHVQRFEDAADVTRWLQAED